MTERIPLLPVRSTVVFPQGATALQIGFEPNVEALNAHTEPDLIVAIVSTAEDGSPLDTPLDPRSMQKIGVTARVLDRLNLPGGTVQTTLQGLARVHLEDIRMENGYYTARIRPAEEIPADEQTAQELIEQILNTVSGVAAKVEQIPNEVPRILRMNLSDPSRFADLAASLSQLNVLDRDTVLQRLDVEDRLRFVLERLEETWERIQAIEEEGVGGEAVQEASEFALAPGDRRTRIRKRIQALQAELGEIDPAEREADELLRRAERTQLPPRVSAVARRETERLRAPGTSVLDADEIRNYLELLLSIPWNSTAGQREIDLDAVEHALDEEHLGLARAKQQIMEILSVAALRGDMAGAIPCIVGPPGVGKTTLAYAVARGMGRPVAQIAMRGRGEAQLIGVPRTRSEAHPGKLLTSLRDTGVRDPVFILEEMDEIGIGNVDGDPIEAMEEFLHPENRDGFTDRYLNVTLDLSDVFFIATAHDYYRIPQSLRDYFIEIQVSGYTPEEKVQIARERLLPRMIMEHGQRPEHVEVSDDVLLFLARAYARDAGLGNLSRALAAILRSRARALTAGEDGHWVMTAGKIEQVLGQASMFVSRRQVVGSPVTRGYAHSDSKRRLKVFLCHGKEDKEKIQELYEELRRDGMDPWLDKANLLPGDDWQLEIPIAVQGSDIVLVCLSRTSTGKRGYVHKEIKCALDAADTLPERERFVIPVRLEDCAIPERLGRWQGVDLFEEGGYDLLLRALNEHAVKLGLI